MSLNSAREMRRGAGAERTIGQFVGIGFRRRDQVSNRLNRRLGIDYDDIEGTRNQRDGREILVRVVGQFGIQAWIDRVGERPHQQRVAIRLAGCDGLGSDDGPRARFVLDNDRGAEILRHLLRQRARDHVGAAARRKRHHDPDDPVRIAGQSLVARKR